MFTNFLENLRLITMSLINYLNFKFCSLKFCIKKKVYILNSNNIQLTWNLTYNPIVRFLKYVVILIFLVGIVAISYKHVCSQS